MEEKTIKLKKHYWYICKKDYTIYGDSGTNYTFKEGNEYPISIHNAVFGDIGINGTRVLEFRSVLLNNFECTYRPWNIEDEKEVINHEK